MSLRNVLCVLGMSLFLSALVLAQGPPEGVGPSGETPVTPPVPDALTVQVDCANGESINDALATPAVELTVEIFGICDEDVLVQRDNVTLIGLDPDLTNPSDPIPIDGIRGVSTVIAPPNFGATLLLHDVVNVTVEDLILTGGVISGLKVINGGSGPLATSVKNCRLVANGGRALDLAHASVIFEDTDITGNGSLAFLVASSFVCRDCVIAGDLTSGGSRVVLEDSTFNGRFQVLNHSLIRLNDGTVQTVTGGPFNRLDSSSQLTMDGGSSIVGDTELGAFSTGVLAAGTDITGSLVCETGSDVVCDNSGQVSASSDCSSCIAP